APPVLYPLSLHDALPISFFRQTAWSLSTLAGAGAGTAAPAQVAWPSIVPHGSAAAAAPDASKSTGAALAAPELAVFGPQAMVHRSKENRFDLNHRYDF